MDAQYRLIIECLRYDPETGVIRWNVSRGKMKAGDKAGTIHSTGYVHIAVAGRKYMGHRIAWFLYHGQWPEGEIDHINVLGSKADNRIVNLRDVTRSDNRKNLKSHALGRLLGTTPVGNSWQAQICLNGTVHYLGLFPSEEEAHEAYMRRLLQEGE